MVSPAGAASTVTVPFLFLFSGSTVANLPTLVNVKLNVCPGVNGGDVNGQVAQTTWWFTVSLFVQVTVSPVWTVTAAGTKPSLLMSTVTVFAGAGAASSRPTAPTTRITLFIRSIPSPGSGLAAVADSDRVAPRIQVARSRLVRGHVHPIRERSLAMRSFEDPTRKRTELQLQHRHPLAERRASLQEDRPAGKRPRPGELCVEPGGGRPRQSQLRTDLDGHGLARCRLPFRRVIRQENGRRCVGERAAGTGHQRRDLLDRRSIGLREDQHGLVRLAVRDGPRDRRLLAVEDDRGTDAERHGRGWPLDRDGAGERRMESVVVADRPGRVEREGVRLAGPHDRRREGAVVGDELVIHVVGVRPLDHVALVDRQGLRTEPVRGD